MFKVNDTSARKIEEPVLKLYEGNFDEKTKLNVYENPHAKRIKEIENTIDCLLDIRLELSIKKLLSNVISKFELTSIVDKAKQNTKDEVVKQEIDKMFDEYLITKDNALPSIPSSSDAWEKNSTMLATGVEAKINNEIDAQKLSLKEMEEMSKDDYQDNGSEKGVSMVKTDKHYKGSNAFTEMQKND